MTPEARAGHVHVLRRNWIPDYPHDCPDCIAREAELEALQRDRDAADTALGLAIEQAVDQESPRIDHLVKERDRAESDYRAACKQIEKLVVDNSSMREALEAADALLAVMDESCCDSTCAFDEEKAAYQAKREACK